MAFFSTLRRLAQQVVGVFIIVPLLTERVQLIPLLCLCQLVDSMLISGNGRGHFTFLLEVVSRRQ